MDADRTRCCVTTGVLTALHATRTDNDDGRRHVMPDTDTMQKKTVRHVFFNRLGDGSR